MYQHAWANFSAWVSDRWWTHFSHRCNNTSCGVLREHFHLAAPPRISNATFPTWGGPLQKFAERIHHKIRRKPQHDKLQPCRAVSSGAQHCMMQYAMEGANWVNCTQSLPTATRSAHHVPAAPCQHDVWNSNWNNICAQPCLMHNTGYTGYTGSGP